MHPFHESFVDHDDFIWGMWVNFKWLIERSHDEKAHLRKAFRCNHACTALGNLQQHTRMQSVEIPYKCYRCNKSIKHNKSFTDHSRIFFSGREEFVLFSIVILLTNRSRGFENACFVPCRVTCVIKVGFSNCWNFLGAATWHDFVSVFVYVKPLLKFIFAENIL